MKGRRHHFYLDVDLLMAGPRAEELPAAFERALFFVTADSGGRLIRHQALRPTCELTNTDQEVEAGALPIGCVFDPIGYLADWKARYMARTAQREVERYVEYDRRWDRLVKPWLERIRTYPFPVVELRADMPLSAICHIFEKVNSRGVALNVFDLCSAVLWPQGFRLNDVWRETCQRFSAVGIAQPPSGVQFLQGIALLASFERQQDGQTAAGVSCRRNDLPTLTAESVQRWWGALTEGFLQASGFLRCEGIVAEGLMPYPQMAVTLAALFALHPDLGRQAANCTLAKLRQWYWCSVFVGRYRSRPEAVIAEDFVQVNEWLLSGARPKAVSEFEFEPDLLHQTTAIQGALGKAIMCLLLRSGALDWDGEGNLGDSWGRKPYEQQAIFPMQALSRLGIDRRSWRSIANRTPMTPAVAKALRTRGPSGFAAGIDHAFGPGRANAMLASHGIDPEAIRRDDWRRFLPARTAWLQARIEDLCGSKPREDGELSRA